MYGVAPATSTITSGSWRSSRPAATVGSPASAISAWIAPGAGRPGRSPAPVRATATTGAPAWANAVAMPRPRPRLAPTTIVVLSVSEDICVSLRDSGCRGQFVPASAGFGSPPTASGCSGAVVAVAAGASSRRRTSTKIAGSEISAIAPSTHIACWKPPVSATGTALPACASALVWLAATLEAIAIPIAPPSCSDVLSSPDASPARCSSTPASAAIEIGMNENAVPAPATRHRPGEVRPGSGRGRGPGWPR